MTVKNNEASMNQTAKKYLQDLSREYLIIPPTPLKDFVNSCFTVLEYTNEFISNEVKLATADFILHEYVSKSIFTCDTHVDLCYKFCIRTIANIYYNNKRKLSCYTVKKYAVKSFKRRQ